MTVKVTVHQLQEHLPEIISRTVKDDRICVIERNGRNVAVIVSAREWRRRTIGDQLDALGPEYRLPRDKQRRAEELLTKRGEHRLTKTERRELDALLRECDDILLRRTEAIAIFRVKPGAINTGTVGVE